MKFAKAPLTMSPYKRFAQKHHFLGIGLPMMSTMLVAFYIVYEFNKGKYEVSEMGLGQPARAQVASLTPH